MALLKIEEPVKNLDNEASTSEVVVGIDLGTTNSLVGLIVDEKVQIFADENGGELHKSVVEFDKSGNVVSVGNVAVLDATKNFIKISSIKRLMGKGFSDVKNSREKFSFEFDESSDDKGFLLIKIGEKKYSAAEISAEILKYLKNLAEKKLGVSVKKAVITVPAYFDEAAKNATKFAAQLAGLEVLRLVSEPTAAALAYGLDNSSEGTYAVYDLGGGTFDVSILKMQRGVFKVLGVSGDAALGGDDFDDILAEEIYGKIDEKIDFSTAKILARKTKEELSFNDTAKSYKNVIISRKEFEHLIAEKINKTISLTTKLIEDLNLETIDIKGVILVGGSSRIPLIHQKFIEIFGAEKILTNLDPDRVVAIGAAWQAFNLSGANNNRSLLLDVIPLSLGIEMMGGIVDKVILRNSAIPASVTKEFTTYADNQNGMKLHIVQGEREFAQDCRSLAQFEIKNIPAMKAGMARIAVTFKVDVDGLLTVTAEEKITGAKQGVVVKPSFGIDENEVKKMLLDSMKNAASDMENRLLAQVTRDARQSALILKNDLQEFGELISSEEKTNIAEKLLQLENLLNSEKNRKSISLAAENLEKAAENLVLQKINKSLKFFVGKVV